MGSNLASVAHNTSIYLSRFVNLKKNRVLCHLNMLGLFRPGKLDFIVSYQRPLPLICRLNRCHRLPTNDTLVIGCRFAAHVLYRLLITNSRNNDRSPARTQIEQVADVKLVCLALLKSLASPKSVSARKQWFSGYRNATRESCQLIRAYTYD